MKKYVLIIVRFIMYCCSMVIRLFSKIDSHKVFCIANEGKIYGCSPKYISEYILSNSSEYQVYWIFDKHTDVSEVDPRIHIVKPFSLKYLWTINTAGFVFNNFRSRFYNLSWKKRNAQKYIMTWHGPMPLKKIEKDVTAGDRNTYIEIIDKDNKCCDLMLSCSKFTTELIRRAMDYKGEVLEEGVPRNDILFKTKTFSKLKEKVFSKYNISNNEKVVLYAPTFRTNHGTDKYNIDWSIVSPALNKFFYSDKFVILYRLHPDLLIKFDFGEECNGRIINVSDYLDIQELLCVADLFITDYSSTMFEFALLKKPCILFASDYETYDRQFYFDIQKLPFPLATNSESLAVNIMEFDKILYNNKVNLFMSKEIGFFEKYDACGKLFNWMQKQVN